MSGITNEIALRAAINLLRDSAELHRQAADHLDALRVGGGQVVADPTGEGRDAVDRVAVALKDAGYAPR